MAARFDGAVDDEGDAITDVVKIAKERRAALAAEVARIDDFVRMAEALIKFGKNYDQGLATKAERPVAEADSRIPEADVPVSEAKSAFEDISTVIEMRPEDHATAKQATADHATGGESVVALEGAASAAATVEPTITVECDLTTAFADTAIAREVARRAMIPKIDLTSVDSDHFAFDQEQEEVVGEQELRLQNRVSSEPSPVNVHIGQRLRQRRWMLGMSQQQLGKITGVKFDQIQKYETGANPISVRSMWDLAAALEVTVSHFFENLDGQAADMRDSRSDNFDDEQATELAGGGAAARSA